MSGTEFEIIERYFRRATPGDVVIGIGDDAAILDTSGPLAVTVDTLVEDVHFPRDLPAKAVGYRVLAVSLSDLAAMGAEPRWCTLALTVPEPEPDWLGGFAEGLFELAERFGVSLVGGDLTRGPRVISLQLLGRLPPEAKPLTRAGGRIGDDIYVTGTLGDGIAGLRLLEERSGEAEAAKTALQERFCWPKPRVAEGRALSPLASAAIDVSDGLLADLGHLCAASGCGARIDVERLPLSRELLSVFPRDVAETYALNGGDDYELCFTAPPAQAAPIEAALGALECPVGKIGRLVEGGGVDCTRGGEIVEPPRAAGYRHF